MKNEIKALERIHELHQQAEEAQNRLDEAVRHLADRLKTDEDCIITLMWVYLRRALDETDTEPLKKLIAKGLVREVDELGNLYVNPNAFPEYELHIENRNTKKE